MKKYGELLLDSMVKHDPSILPLAETFAATENGKPAALCMMTCWRSITKIHAIDVLIADEKLKNVVISASVDENGLLSVFMGRLKIENELITEIELYLVRSRAEAGFWYAPEDMGQKPFGWGKEIPEGGKATRAELEELGKALHDPSYPKEYEAAPDCFLMELGGVVREHVDYVYAINPWLEKGIFKETRNPIPFGIPPTRPADPNARLIAVDEEQGIVVTIATVDGFISPYIVSDEISSCFVPESMIDMHRRTLTPEKMKGKSLVKESPATGFTTTFVRFFSGKVQGYNQTVYIAPYGAKLTWK